MFELTTPTDVALDKVNTRIEHHGEAHVLAIDLKVTLTTNNLILDRFHPKLRSMLFCALAAEAKAEQGELELPVSDLPNVTFTKLEYPIKWDLEATGYTCTVDHGLGGKSNVMLNLCTLKNFKLSPIEGGSCEVEFTISSAADIDERIAGKLSVMQQTDIAITLLAPAAIEGVVIDASAGSGAPGTGPAAEPAKAHKAKNKAHRDATDAFVDAHAHYTMTTETITWINVADALPDDETNVLCFDEESMTVMEGFYDGDEDGRQGRIGAR